MRTEGDIVRLLEETRNELRRLEVRRSELLELVAELEQEKSALALPQENSSQLPAIAAFSNQSRQEDKVAFFRSLFRGREDVYPRRFESQKTGKSGYQPVCRNEWIKGICRKPQIKCDDCGFRQLLPVTDDVIRNHLLGVDPQSGSRPRLHDRGLSITARRNVLVPCGRFRQGVVARRRQGFCTALRTS